ncbi:MAG: hypothetical protein HY426_02550 [Candidatus Levybacteria bacterium]|nr:hypothetical protein [Candidatus Levybacteria bacterium]
MGSLIEALGREGILPSEFGLWQKIREAQAAYDWIAPDPLVSMQFALASETQKAIARRRVDEAIQTACDTLGLVRDLPVVEEGQPIPPTSDGRQYFQDWFGNIASSVVSARNGSSESTVQ